MCVCVRERESIFNHPLLFVHPYSWPAMCIHGDKHQSEREWVLGGKNSHPNIVDFVTFSLCFTIILLYPLLRVSRWKESHLDCYRCCLQRIRYCL